MDDSDVFDQAETAAENAYAPYSGVCIGAAVETTAGEVYAGCNVENSAFNPSTHAEQNAISSAVSDGWTEFERIAIAGLEQSGVPPCGHCRQIIAEFCGPNFDVYSKTTSGYHHWALKELFPDPFEFDGPTSECRGDEA